MDWQSIQQRRITPRTTGRYFDAATGVGPGPSQPGRAGAPVQAPAAAPKQPCPTVAPMQPCPTVAPAQPCQMQFVGMHPIQPRPTNTPPVTLRPANSSTPSDGWATCVSDACSFCQGGARWREHGHPGHPGHPGPGPYHGHPAEAKAIQVL